VTRTSTVPGNSRFNIWVDEEPGLSDVAVSTRITSTNGVGIIVERSMWWPGPTSATWQEAHDSPGETSTGTRWAFAEGEVGGPRQIETYVLIANTFGIRRHGARHGDVRGRHGAYRAHLPAQGEHPLERGPGGGFPETAGKTFGMLPESLGAAPAQIVVERAMYSDAGGAHWAAGTNALATKLPSYFSL
jgi:hypothetical protein